MDLEKNKRRAVLSWLFVATLFVLCAILGVLQYRWIAEVTVAARERLRAGLQVNLFRLSEDFNRQISSACSDLVPSSSAVDAKAAEQQVVARYQQWTHSGKDLRMFSGIALAVPREDNTLELRVLDLNKGVFRGASWPIEWAALPQHITARQRTARGIPAPPLAESERADEGLAFEAPLFAPANPSAPPFSRREIGWLIFALNPQYVREVLLPEQIQRYLGADGNVDYLVEVVSKAGGRAVVYQSEPGEDMDIASAADASVSLFQPQIDLILHKPPPNGDASREARPSDSAAAHNAPAAIAHKMNRAGVDTGRWEMYVRHKAGSLEAVVLQTRLRNMAVTGGVLLLMIATVAALLRYTRRAQRLADLQLEFVAGVSHELRTPLTVINTAGYNLQGKVAQNPGQVERYGALIQQESGRLGSLVEQVLRFASMNSSRAVQQHESFSVETVIKEAVESSKRMIEGSNCSIEKEVDPSLPRVVGDAVALRHALENLVSNAIKYGAAGNWIGISAVKAADQKGVEIRVADRGPGIPKKEQSQIFDPFFRGSRAVQDQVHGTGLGLSLVKKIVEAHGGTIRVESTPGKGAAFIMRLPAAPAGVAG